MTERVVIRQAAVPGAQRDVRGVVVYSPNHDRGGYVVELEEQAPDGGPRELRDLHVSVLRPAA